MTSDTLIGAENRSRRVETVETGLKQVSRAEQPLGAAGGAVGASPERARAEPRDRLHRCVTRGSNRASHVVQ